MVHCNKPKVKKWKRRSQQQPPPSRRHNNTYQDFTNIDRR